MTQKRGNEESDEGIQDGIKRLRVSSPTNSEIELLQLSQISDGLYYSQSHDSYYHHSELQHIMPINKVLGKLVQERHKEPQHPKQVVQEEAQDIYKRYQDINLMLNKLHRKRK